MLAPDAAPYKRSADARKAGAGSFLGKTMDPNSQLDPSKNGIPVPSVPQFPTKVKNPNSKLDPSKKGIPAPAVVIPAPGVFDFVDLLTFCCC